MLLRRASPASPSRREPRRPEAARPMTSPRACTMSPSVSRCGPVRMCVASSWASSTSARTATAATSLGSMGSDRQPRSAGGRRRRPRISGAHANELVANLPARRNVHTRPNVRIKCSMSAWIDRHRMGLLLQVVVHGQRGDVDDAVRVACDRLAGCVRVFGARLVPEQEHRVDVVQCRVQRRRHRQVAAGDLEVVGPPRRCGIARERTDVWHPPPAGSDTTCRRRSPWRR